MIIVSAFDASLPAAMLCPVSARPRHPQWERESGLWKRDHPCAVTAESGDVANWITLRQDWHFYLGHAGNWSNWNPSVKDDAERFRRLVESFRRRGKDVVG
jgi:hypothetical protein